MEEVFQRDERETLDLVIGKQVHNPHQVVRAGAVPETFVDGHLQYCFRKQSGDLLLRDKNKIGVELFDVYLPPFVGGEGVGND